MQNVQNGLKKQLDVRHICALRLFATFGEMTPVSRLHTRPERERDSREIMFKEKGQKLVFKT